MRRISALVVCSVVGIVLFACSFPQPAQDSSGTEIAGGIYATLTASAAVPTPTSTSLPIPSLTPLATQPPTVSDYYPLAVGDYWVYRRIDGDGTVLGQTRKEVTGTQEMEGITVVVLRRWHLGGNCSDSYYRVAGDHVASFGTDECEDSPATYHRRRPTASPWRVLDIPLEVGQERRWEETARLTDPDNGESIECVETHYVVEAVESVDVTAGHFEGCYRVRQTLASATVCSYEPQIMTELYWFCPGVGTVRAETIAFPHESGVGMVVELVEYEVH